MTRSEFGHRVMRWGTGYEAAVTRTATMTAEWLKANGVDVAMMRAWLDFYERTYERNPANESARGRAVLARHCISLLEVH